MLKPLQSYQYGSQPLMSQTMTFFFTHFLSPRAILPSSRKRAQALDTKMEPVQLEISTMSTRVQFHVRCLQVRAFYSDRKISLPVTYQREFIPANRTHISTLKTASTWPHLAHIAEEIAPQQVCEIGHLIGFLLSLSSPSQRHCSW